MTAALWKQAQAVATEIEEQKGATDDGGDGGDGSGSGAGSGSGGSGGGGSTGTTPGSVTEVGGTTEEERPDDGQGKGDGKGGGTGKGDGKGDRAGDEDPEQELVAMPPTTEVSSPVAERMLPLLLLVALISAVAANLIRLRHLRRRRS